MRVISWTECSSSRTSPGAKIHRGGVWLNSPRNSRGFLLLESARVLACALPRIYLVRYIRVHAIHIRHPRRAASARHPHSARRWGAVRGRSRIRAQALAALRVQASTCIERRRLRRGHDRRATPCVSAPPRAAAAGGRLDGPVSPVLVGAPRCPRAPSRPHGDPHTYHE